MIFVKYRNMEMIKNLIEIFMLVAPIEGKS